MHRPEMLERRAPYNDFNNLRGILAALAAYISGMPGDQTNDPREKPQSDSIGALACPAEPQRRGVSWRLQLQPRLFLAPPFFFCAGRSTWIRSDYHAACGPRSPRRRCVTSRLTYAQDPQSSMVDAQACDCADVCFAAHNRLKSDITPCPKSAEVIADASHSIRNSR